MSNREPRSIPWRHRMLVRYYRRPEHAGRLRLLRWLKGVLGVSKVLDEVTPGVVMELDDADFVQREILFRGGYELATLQLFDRLLAGARGFLDIGGHHGQYTLRAARALAARNGRVFTFEPTPANAAALLRNATLSGLDNIDLCTVALSDSPGILRMVQPVATNTGGSRLATTAAPALDGGTILVAVRPFEDVAALVPPEAFDLVKIDVEGYEARVLASLFSTSAPRPRQILLEYIPSGFDYGVPGGLPAWLQAHGYRLRSVMGDDYSPDRPLPEDNLWAERVQ
jgi:FkbM family methyltransferase